MTNGASEQFQGIEEVKTNGASSPPSSTPVAVSVFDDLDALRIVDPAALGGDIEHLAHIAVRKPKKDEYFRTHPDPAMSLTSLVWTDPDLGDVYFVAPEARQIMTESGRVVTLVLCQSRLRVNFIWPVNAGGSSGGGRGWVESSHHAVHMGKNLWIKIRGDRPAGMYQVLEAADQRGEPEWPNLDFKELLKLGFKDRLIGSADHPVVRRIQGFV